MKPSIWLIKGTKSSRIRRPASAGSRTPSYLRIVAYIASPQVDGPVGALLGAPRFSSSAGERSLCLTLRRVLIRRLQETAQLGAQLLVVLVAVYRGSVLGRGLHHLIRLADNHQ